MSLLSWLIKERGTEVESCVVNSVAKVLRGGVEDDLVVEKRNIYRGQRLTVQAREPLTILAWWLATRMHSARHC